MTPEDVMTYLIGPLALVYAMPIAAREMAEQLARECGAWVTAANLEALAERIVGARRSKTFPTLPAMLALVRAIPRPAGTEMRYGKQAEADKLRLRDEAELRAISLLRGSPAAQRAIAGRWAPAMLEFATMTGRLPEPDEESRLIAASRINDVDVRDLGGPFANAMQRARATMHETAARRLGLTADAPENVAVR